MHQEVSNQSLNDEKQSNFNKSRVKIPATAISARYEAAEDSQLPETHPHRPNFFKSYYKTMQTMALKQKEDNIKNEDNMKIPVMASYTEGNCKVLHVLPIKTTGGKLFIGIFLSLITIGIFWLVCRRNNFLYKYFFYSICNFNEASSYLVQNSDGSVYKQNKFVKQGLNNEEIIGFNNRYMDYFYNAITNKFKAREFHVHNLKTQDLLNQKGLSADEVQKRQSIYGQCTIDFDIMNVFSFLWQQMTQVPMLLVYLSVIVWILEKYYVFAINISWITALTLVILYIFYRHSNKKILQKTTQVQPVLRITNSQSAEKIQSNSIVPEDIIEIQTDTELPCDIILISGECFVNEANITGETDPVPKVQIQNDSTEFSYSEHSSSVIYEGTRILNVSDNTRGIVIRTGFSTKKGQVIRDTLFKTFKTNDFIKSLLYFNVTTTIIFIAFFFVCQFWLSDNDKIPTNEIWLKLGEGIVVLLASTLIPAINISMIAAIVRLQNRKIQGVHPESIYESGGIDVICMDKTGTITEQKINPKYVYNNITKQQITIEDIQNKKFQQNEQIIQKLFATCIQAQPDQKDPKNILGNEIDVQLFKLSEYAFAQNNNQSVLFEVTKDNNQLQVLKRFDFKSVNACMTVIVKDGNQGYVFVKGSPEKLRAISKVSSLPMGFDDQLQHYLNDGYRVLGMGFKQIDLNTIDNLDRSEIEKNLDYLGFIVLENKLKNDSFEVFQRLLSANVPIKVISGDNMFTVAHTAAQLKLFTEDKPIYYLDTVEEGNLQVKTKNVDQIDLIEKEYYSNQRKEVMKFFTPLLSSGNNQFCMSGRVIKFFNDMIKDLEGDEKMDLIHLFERLVLVTRAFGRCSPYLKKSIITIIQHQDHKVCMLGDGSNDCLAIQQSNVGISFSNADAALASSFCSLTDSIDCVEKVMAEGRSSLSIMYETSHYFIQTGVLRLIFHMIAIFYYQSPGDSQLVFFSYYGGYILTMIFYYFTSPMTTLSHFRINYLMTGKRSIIGILGRWIFPLIASLVMLDQLKGESFYVEDVDLIEEDSLNQEGQVNSFLFYMCAILCAFTPYQLYTSYPSKLGLHKNIILSFLILLTSVMSILVLYLDESTFSNLKLDDSITTSFKNKILAASLVVGFAQLAWEKFVVNIKFQMASVNVIPELK